MAPLYTMFASLAVVFLIIFYFVYRHKRTYKEHPTFHRIKHGKIYVSYYMAVKNTGQYHVYVFEKKNGKYLLTKDSKNEMIHNVKSMSLFGALIILINLIVMICKGAGIFTIIGVSLLFLLVFAGVAIEMEYSEYSQCIKYLKKNSI